jgi:threonine/homoserine efflux transporter RhtA
MTTSLLGVLDEVAVPVWMGVAWVIVLGTLAPYSLNLAALRHVPPTIVGAVGMCEPGTAYLPVMARLRVRPGR